MLYVVLNILLQEENKSSEQIFGDTQQKIVQFGQICQIDSGIVLANKELKGLFVRLL